MALLTLMKSWTKKENLVAVISVNDGGKFNFVAACGKAAAAAGARVHVRGRLSRRQGMEARGIQQLLGDGLDPPWEPGGRAGAP